MVKLSERLVDDCRADWRAIASMMQASWAENTQTSLFYTEEYLASLFSSPGASLAFAPAIYDNDRPVAFVAGFPRRVRLGRDRLNVMTAALLTVAPACKQRGYGIIVWTDLVRRARAAGFDGMVNYCVAGDSMERMIAGASRRLGFSASRVFSVRYSSRLLPPAAMQGAAADVDPPTLVRLARAAGAGCDMAREMSPAEAAWLRSRRGGMVVTVRGRNSEGALTGYVVPVSDRHRTQCLVVDDILWGGLTFDERRRLVEQLVVAASAAGARIAIVPDMGYAEMAPFHESRFRPSGKVIQLYLSRWDGTPEPAAVSSCYLDVF
jgi:hypothetical protein